MTSWNTYSIGPVATAICATAGWHSGTTASLTGAVHGRSSTRFARLPIAGSLVWLALYASKEAALAKRLEEDYAYKAAVSTSFQGFQEQMKQVQKDAGPDTPLGKLCADTLATIASPPGRIYDKHSLTTSPSTELVELAKAILNAAGKAPGKA
jgi:hypothetical protein